MPTKTVEIVIDEALEASYSGSRIKDGVWQIVYKPKDFGTNSGDAVYTMPDVIDAGIP